MNTQDQPILASVRTTNLPAWRGWFRRSRRERWRLLVEGDDERAVHDDMLARSPGGGELLFLPGTEDPNKERILR